MNVEDFCLEAGLSGQIYQMPLAYMTESWFFQTWYQCRLLQIEITMDIEDFEKPRRGNQEIMRLFLQGRVQGPELASLNRCRMYLQAIYVSDICTGDGQAIDPRFWDGREQCQMAYRWPRMECPTSNKWNMWHKTLMKALSLGQRDSLAKPLGNWMW